MSHTEATVDLAMMFIVISEPVALTQSLIILLVGAKWVLQENFVPCAEQPCGLLECIQYKDSIGLPNVKHNFQLFRFHTGIPRSILHMLAGSHLTFIFRSHAQYSPQRLFMQ